MMECKEIMLIVEIIIIIMTGLIIALRIKINRRKQMSGSKAKKLRQAFELQLGFTPDERGSDVYKYEWKKFKNMIKRGE